MRRPNLKTLLFVAAVAGGLLLAYWSFLFLVQRSVMFPGAASMAASPRQPEVRQVWLDTPAGDVEAWYLPATAEEEGPVILFAHGNAEIIDYWPREFQEPRSWGVSVLLVEYPGYGRSEGNPSKESVTATMVAAREWALEELGATPDRIVGYGRSLGAAAVCALAAERDVAALVLESAFTSVSDLAAGYGLPSFLVRNPFDSREALAGFDGPVLLLHGAGDRIIPAVHSRRLHEVASDSRLEILPCGHNDCPRPWKQLRQFLEDNSLLRP